MLNLTLPAIVLDGFRIYCLHDKLETWIDRIQATKEIDAVAQQVLDQLFSARRVERLRRAKPSQRTLLELIQAKLPNVRFGHVTLVLTCC